MNDNPYFSHNELACRCCNKVVLQKGFMENLVKLREAWGKPMVVNSCCRCQKHNDSVGGKGKSFHIFGMPQLTGIPGTCAIDIGTAGLTGPEKWNLAYLAMQHGWSIGIAKTFLHFDRRSDYPETGWDKPVLFTY